MAAPLKVCPHCGHESHTEGKTCPACGKKYSGIAVALKTFFTGSRRQPGRRYVNYVGTIFWAIVIAALGAATISALVNLWPAVDPTIPTGATAAQQDAAAQNHHTVTFLWGAFDLSLNKSSGLIVLAVLAGALGSFVQASLAFVHWTGQRQLYTSFVWWYGFRLFSGAALAAIVYFAVRGGLFGSENATTEVNAYGTAAFAGLVGLFSKQAIAKLQEVFNNLFRTDTKEAASADSGTTPQEKKQGPPDGKDDDGDGPEGAGGPPEKRPGEQAGK